MATEELLLNADITWDETSVPGYLKGLIAPLAVKNAHLFGAITNDKLAGGITSSQLAGGITADKLAFAINALTDAASIITAGSPGPVFTVTINGNRTLANPTSPDPGITYYWVITQGAGGNFTLAYDTLFTFPGGTPPTLSTAAGAVDVLMAVYDGLKLRAQLTKAYA